MTTFDPNNKDHMRRLRAMPVVRDPFICDGCGKPITHIGDTHVAWVKSARPKEETKSVGLIHGNADGPCFAKWTSPLEHFAHINGQTFEYYLEALAAALVDRDFGLYIHNVAFSKTTGLGDYAPCVYDITNFIFIKSSEILYGEPAKYPQPISPRLRFQILKRDGFRCQYCGHSAKDGATLEVDHKIPRAKGGSNAADNLLTACWECNRGKSDEDL